MTGYLAIRQSVYDAQSDLRKVILQSMGSSLEVESLGDGGVFNNGAQDFYVWGDTRWGQDQLCGIGAIAANIASLADDVAERLANSNVNERSRSLRGYVYGWMDGQNLITLPENVPDSGTGNRGQELLTAQGAPNAVKFLNDLTGWTQGSFVPPDPEG